MLALVWLRVIWFGTVCFGVSYVNLRPHIFMS